MISLGTNVIYSGTTKIKTPFMQHPWDNEDDDQGLQLNYLGDQEKEE